jgi:Flp pilus assembly protein TadB
VSRDGERPDPGREPIPPAVWVVVAGTFVVVVANAGSPGLAAAQVGVLLALLVVYFAVRRRRTRG